MIHNDALNYIRAADETCHKLFDQDFDKDDRLIYARHNARRQALHEVGVKLFGDAAYHAALSEHIARKRHKRLAEWATGFETNESSRIEE